MEYEKAKQLLIKDLRGLTNTKACIWFGDKVFTAAELAKEIEDETEIGKNHINLFMEAMNHVEQILLNQPPKKWWQFWRK
jgi:hypothetical protein